MIQSEIDKMREAGTIRRSTSPWAVGLVLVRKIDGMLRFCVKTSACRTSAWCQTAVVSGTSPLTIIHSNMGQVGCSTSIDLASGFNQIPIAKKTKVQDR